MQVAISAKEQAVNLISNLPNESDFEDIFYALYVQNKVNKAILEVENNTVIDHNLITQEFPK